MSRPIDTVLLLDGSAPSLDAYVEGGGGQGLAAALRQAPEQVIEEIRRSGLRGQGGAGFPTGIKWRTVREDPCPTKYVVCNAAEGEPGTFKDRWLLRMNPYQVLEGLGIAAHAVGAKRAYIGLKAGFQEEVERLRRAMEEMAAGDLLGPVPVELVPGPDEYLFGEEKALLEVIEGNDPVPRIVPPWMEGLFREPGSPNPTAVNNVETLANVPHIQRERTGSARWGPRTPRGPWCSHCVATSAIRACTSSHWVSLSATSSSGLVGVRPRCGAPKLGSTLF